MIKKVSDEDFEAQDYRLVDARGLLCPEPVMMLHNAIRQVAEGGLLKVLATDPSTERDIINFCEHLKHPLVFWQKESNLYTYWVQKKIVPERTENV
jgi:tRNA 2-thiouridine synthesizing protein A